MYFAGGFSPLSQRVSNGGLGWAMGGVGGGGDGELNL